MRNKYFVYGIILVLSLFLMAACSPGGSIVAEKQTQPDQTQPDQTQPDPSPDAATSPTAAQSPSDPAQTTQTPSPTQSDPSPSPAALDEPEYAVEDGKVYRQTAQGKKLVYVAAAHHNADAECGIGDWILEDGVLYFLESCLEPDAEHYVSQYFIIRLDGDDRRVLDTVESPHGAPILWLYQDRIIYANEGGDSFSLHDIGTDGSEPGKIMDAFADKYGHPSFGMINHRTDGDKLVLEGLLYLYHNPEDFEDGMARMIIYPDMHAELEWNSSYDVVDGNTIYLRTEGGKRLVYAAAPHYEKNASCHIWNVLDDGDALYFIETGDVQGEYGRDTKWSIIRLENTGRHVLATMTCPFGFSRFVFYQNRIIYAIEWGDSYSIGDMKKDGSERNKIMDAFADKYGYPSMGRIDYKRENGCLLMEGLMYLNQNPSEWLEGKARIIIYPGLRTELEWLTEPVHHD